MPISTRMKVLLIIVLVHACLSGCPGGHFSDKYKGCNKCHSSCGECSGPSENSCLSCPGSKIFHQSKSCCVDSCPDGWFREVSRGRALCTVGHSSCKTCSGPRDSDCLSCRGSQILHQGRCWDNCPDGWFKDMSRGNAICTVGHSSCKTCNGPRETDCLTCPIGKYYHEVNHSCCSVCPAPYVPMANGKCGKCSDGTFYNSTAKACQNCTSPCKTCGDTGLLCLSCISYNYLFEPNHTCGVSCPDGYFKNTTSQICKKCDASCKTCNGPKETDCLTCPLGKYYHEASHTCCLICPAPYVPMANGKCGKCDDGTYYDSSSKKCLPCKSSCKTCDGPKATDCKSCRASKVLYKDQCYDECPDGLYESGNTCLPCQAPCENCKKSATKCTSCKKWYKLVQNTCVFDCPDGWFKDMSRGNAICTVGHSSCKTCSGPKDSDCLSCRGSQILHQGRCYDKCPDGWFKDMSRGNAICTVGHSSCKTCNGPRDSDCLSCRGSQILHQGRCWDNCPDGWFKDMSRGNAICTVGHSSCKTCKGPKDSDCLSCRGAQILFQGRCSDACPDGHYHDRPRNMCNQCHSNCAKCKDTNVNCQSCNSGCFLTGNSCVTKCPFGQRGDNSKRQCMKLLRNLDAPDADVDAESEADAQVAP